MSSWSWRHSSSVESLRGVRGVKRPVKKTRSGPAQEKKLGQRNPIPLHSRVHVGGTHLLLPRPPRKPCPEVRLCWRFQFHRSAPYGLLVWHLCLRSPLIGDSMSHGSHPPSTTSDNHGGQAAARRAGSLEQAGDGWRGRGQLLAARWRFFNFGPFQ